MYRDYFPGQLDNVDVAQKTRADGTVEVTFKRRIGTKGANVRSTPRHPEGGGSGEVVITLPSVVRVLGALPQDRPLVWDLVEQAIGPKALRSAQRDLARIDRKLTHHSGSSGPPEPPRINSDLDDAAAA
jgi:hypothetical protein